MMKNKRRILTVVSIILGLMISSVFLPTSVKADTSFWEGNDLTEYLRPGTKDALQAILDQAVSDILTSFFMVPNIPEDFPTGLITYERGETWDGYTLICVEEGHLDPNTGIYYGAVLVDMEGNLVHKWPVVSEPAKILPGGYCMAGMGTFADIFTETGMPKLVQMDWDGNIVWEYNGYGGSFPDHQYPAGFHHDFQREGNPVGYYAPGMEPMVEGGKTLVFGFYVPPLEWTEHISRHPLHDEPIYEFDWEGNLTWEWYPWQHFEQMGFDEAAKKAIYEVNSNTLPDGSSDWSHANIITYVGPNKWYDQGDLRFHPDNVMFDQRNTGLIAIIARNDHPKGEWKAGDIVWKVGPDFSYGNPEHKLGEFIGIHGAHLIPKGLPGAGNILLFDNGGLGGFGSLLPGLAPTDLAKFRDYSRVVEFDPMTLDVVWEYHNKEHQYDEHGNLVNPKMFSTFNSNCQRLANGNTLICSGLDYRVLEVTPEKKIVWDFFSPFTSQNEMNFFGGPRVVYRAERVPYEWVPQLSKE
jgi:hypothetical protein